MNSIVTILRPISLRCICLCRKISGLNSRNPSNSLICVKQGSDLCILRVKSFNFGVSWCLITTGDQLNSLVLISPKVKVHIHNCVGSLRDVGTLLLPPQKKRPTNRITQRLNKCSLAVSYVLKIIIKQAVSIFQLSFGIEQILPSNIFHSETYLSQQTLRFYFKPGCDYDSSARYYSKGNLRQIIHFSP